MKINNVEFTFGADPEVFVGDTGPSSVIGKLGGTKDTPLKVVGGAVQEDNVLAEFNIDPAADEDTFVGSIHTVLGILEGMLPAGLSVMPRLSSHEYTAAELRSFGPAAMVFGCDPDYNAYTKRANRPPSAGSGLRTAGGHIHVGYDGPFEEGNLAIIRAMDLLLGVPSVLMDTDTRRRNMYGAAGCLRHKPYGVEYRTLSNFWIFDEQLTRWAFRQTVAAIHLAMKEGAVTDTHTLGINNTIIQECINLSDKATAHKLCADANIDVVYTTGERL